MPSSLCTILERAAQEVMGWNPRGFNPALMTDREYARAVNDRDQWHPDSAYDMTLATMNRFDSDSEKYRLVRQFKQRGLDFQMMVQTTKNAYPKTTPDDEYVRDDNYKLVYHDDAEIKELGLQPTEYNVAIFHDGKRVALASDEWGAMLIAVAREYRGFGLGPIIGKFARSLEPAKSSGGFTPSGHRNILKIHQDLVRDAMNSGLYSNMVKSGEMTAARAREIIQSAHLDKKPKRASIDLSSNDPDQWMLYSDLHGTFILYDRKLRDILEQNVDEHFIDNMIKGSVYLMEDQHAGIARIKRFGAASQKLKAFMLALAYTLSQSWGMDLWVEPEEYDLPRFTYGEESNTMGHSSRQVLSGPTINFTAMVGAEHRYRKTFDTYDEFKYRMHEIADAKY